MMSSRAQSRARARPDAAAYRPLVSRVAALVGAVFVVVGILGFVPGVTTEYGALEIVGHQSEAKLFGVFQVSVLHNLVHLASGVAGLVLARTVAGAQTFLVGGGAAYLILWLYGLAVGHQSEANVFPMNNADNWLHLGLGIGMIALGFGTSTRPAARRADRGATPRS